MKRILLFLLLFPGFAFAQTPAAQRTFSTSTQTADSIVLTENGLYPYHRLMWSISGTITTCQVKLQQSTTGLFAGEETDLIVAQTCTSAGRSVLTIGNNNFVRINPTTLTGGGTLTATYYGYQTYPLMEAGATGAGATAGAVQGTTPTSSTIVGNPVVMGAVQSAGGTVQALVCGNAGGTQCGLYALTSQADGLSGTSTVGLPYNPGNGGGLTAGLRVNLVRWGGTAYDSEIYCPNTTPFSVASTITQLVAISASTKIRVCGVVFFPSTSTAGSVDVVYGTGSNCGTGTTTLTGAVTLPAAAVTSVSVPIASNGPLVTPAAQALCVRTVTSTVAGYVSWEQH